MRACALCKKKALGSCGPMFRVPKDPDIRNKWSQICGVGLKVSSIICYDHFEKNHIATMGKRLMLLPNAVPIAQIMHSSASTRKDVCNNQEESSVCSSDSFTNSNDPKSGRFFSWEQLTNTASASDQISRKENIKIKKNVNSIDPKIYTAEIPKKEVKQIIMPPLLEEPVVKMPVVKSVSCSGCTQTNIRICGLVEASDLADEFRFNCFYCSKVFPLGNWKHFVDHLKMEHFETEEAFKKNEYLSNEHDYTPISLPPPNPARDIPEPVTFKTEPAPSYLIDPLGSVHNPFESVVFDSNLCYTPYKDKTKAKFVSYGARNKTKAYKKSSKRKVIYSNRLYSKFSDQQTSKQTALSRCLKRTIKYEIQEPTTPPPILDETIVPQSIVADQEITTEISFEYTPQPVVDSLLDSMKKYSVLWQFDDEPFNEDFFEAVEDLCNVLNSKFSLKIDNLKMRRSINRILRFYCYIFPNENNDQYTCYYNKLAKFLPSVNEIAYARCSHCYVCYGSDFDLQLHLVEEQKYLEWPYKCSQCKECFRLWDEFEFHKYLPHYDEVFRCQPCKLSFFRRLSYKKHMVEEHHKANEPGRFKCDICDRALETLNGLRVHKKTHGEAPHKCHLCPKAYHAKSRLDLHLKIHRQEPDYMCEVCGKKFFRQPALKIHMTGHTGEKVTCKICNLRLRKSSLGRHLRTVHIAYAGLITKRHFNAKNHCLSRMLKPRTQRPLHIKSGNEREYKCKICQVYFDNYKLIVEHNKELHSDLPRWPCKMCSTEFNAKLNLKGHYRKKHKLHSSQIYKLVEEKEDLSAVLSMEIDDIEVVSEKRKRKKPKKNRERATRTSISSPIKADLLPDEIYFAEEKIHSSTIQDEIMRAADDIEPQDIKIDYINDIFTDFLK